MPSTPSASASAAQAPSVPRAPGSARKLYLPYGKLAAVMPVRSGRLSPMTIHWFVVGRSEPVAPYAAVIQGYRQLQGEARRRAERLVDELFREDEFHQLRDYLWNRHREDTRTSMLVTPVPPVKPDAGTRTGALRPFVKSGDGEGGEGAGDGETPTIHRLADEPDYPLPFTVWGAYVAPAVPYAAPARA